MKKILTIIIAGRNDNYKGNYKKRLENTINYNCKKIDELGYSDKVEITIVDWNSPEPIQNDLILIAEALKICSFININPTIASDYMIKNQVFNLTCSMNIGIRHSNSKYIFIISSDMVISEYAFRNLFELIEKKTKVLFNLNENINIIPTKLLPYDKSMINMSLDDIDKMIYMNGPELKNVCKELPGSGLGHIAMMNKSMWMEFRGYDENLIHYGWHEEEFALRVSQKYSWVNLSFLGIHAFDFAEPESNSDINQITNPHKVPFNLVANDENWGLKKHKLEKVKLKKNKLLIPPSEIKTRLKRNEILDQINSIKSKVNLYKPGKIHLNKTKVEWEVFKILSWYVLNKRCRSFIQVGLEDSANSLMVIDKFPCSDFYIIDSWRNKKNNFKPHFLSDIMRRSGYRGHIRFISGDEDTALYRLIKSKNHKISFDLSILQLEPIKENIKNYIKSIISYSTDESLIILMHDNRQEMIDAIDKNKGLLENCDVFYTKSHQVAFLFKSKLQIDEENENDNSNIIDLGGLPDWNWLIKVNYKRILFNPSKYIHRLFKIIRSSIKNIYKH